MLSKDIEYVSYMFPRVGVALVVKGKENNDVLLQFRIGKHASDVWGFPGGHLEKWETFEEAVLRELKEEAGSDLLVDKPKLWTTVNTFYPAEDKHFITVFMVANHIYGEPIIMEPDKNAGWRWFPWSKLADITLLMPGIQYLVDNNITPFTGL